MLSIQDPENQLPEKQYALLLRLINSRRKQSNKIFDKKDNCFQIYEYRKIELLTGESKSSIGRLFQLLRSRKLLKTVESNQGTNTLMIAPYFYCNGSWIEKRFMKAMYILGSHKLACEWSKACLQNGVLYSPENFNTFELINMQTGEITRPNMKELKKLSPFEVEQWKQYRASYSKFDRTKPRPSLGISS